MRRLGAERLRNDVYDWAVYEDADDDGVFVETFHSASWLEYLRQRERITELQWELSKAAKIRLAREGRADRRGTWLDLKGECKAVGATVQDTLRNLASEIDRLETSVWVPAPAQQYVENGVLKAASQEYGAIHEMTTEFIIGGEPSVKDDKKPC